MQKKVNHKTGKIRIAEIGNGKLKLFRKVL